MKILNKITLLPRLLPISLLLSFSVHTSAQATSEPLPLNQQSSEQTQILDQVVAIVDDDVVLASEVQERLQQLMVNIQRSGRTGPAPEELQPEVLNQLILENIQLQMAYRAGVRISDAQLNDSMSRIAAQNRMTLEQFRQALEQDGMSYNATREQIRRDMLIQRVQQGNVNQRVQITDQEIANFLASEEGQTLTAPEYRMLHTLIPVGSNGYDSAAAKATANKLYQQIQQGKDYDAVIASEPGLTANDLGWRKASDLPSLVSELATTMSPGETAEPVESASGFHLVKMLEKRGDGETIAQTKARHILLKPSAIRDDAATKAQIEKLRRQIINGKDFAALAREYSEDIGSALEGGNLGWTNPGQLVEAFQTAMDNTDIGGISPAFRSEYGWHILQVQDRRNKDVTDDIRRNIARNFIYKRKFDDELQSWLQKIRDEAYVDIKLSSR